MISQELFDHLREVAGMHDPITEAGQKLLDDYAPPSYGHADTAEEYMDEADEIDSRIKLRKRILAIEAEAFTELSEWKALVDRLVRRLDELGDAEHTRALLQRGPRHR